MSQIFISSQKTGNLLSIHATKFDMVALKLLSIKGVPSYLNFAQWIIEIIKFKKIS